MSVLEGRTYAIAGAGGGLGPSVARTLVAAGANVALADRSPDLLAALVGELPAEQVHAATVDLLSPEDTAGWSAAVAQRFEGADGVIHLVGGWRGGTALPDAALEDWALLDDLLVRTVQHTSRAFHGGMIAAGERGRFVLVSALQAQAPSATNASYGAAKAAAEAWTLALADSLKGTGATANIVAVNALVTPEMRAQSPEKAYNTFTDVDEVAAAIAFLCSPAARKMSGKRLVLHGAF